MTCGKGFFMNRFIVALLFVSCCISTSAQFVFKGRIQSEWSKTITKIVTCSDIDNDADIDIYNNDFWHLQLAKDSFDHKAPVAIIPGSKYLFDIDHDGDIDVIQRSWWHENNGNGSFQQHQIGTASNYLLGAIVGDVDGDNDSDLIGYVSYSSYLHWVENLGSGNWSSVKSLAPLKWLGSTDLDLRLVDVDNDGKNDVVTRSGFTIVLNKNLGSSNYSSNDTIVTGWYIGNFWEMVDFDNDFDKDLLMIDEKGVWQNQGRLWYVKNNNGVFGTPQIINTRSDSVQSLKVIDLDLDNDMDFLICSSGDDSLVWYENKGNFNLNNLHLIDDSLHFMLDAEPYDIDQDGDLDIAVYTEKPDVLYWYKNLGNCNYSKRKQISSYIIEYDVTAGDFDSDGLQDVAYVDLKDSNFVWYRNLPNAKFGKQEIISDTLKAWRLVSDDYDGDGDEDIITFTTSLASSSTINLWNNIGGKFAPPLLISDSTTNIQEAYQVDIDNDGDMDIIIRGGSSRGSIFWHENDGAGNFSSRKLIEPNSGYVKQLQHGDANGDGYEDVIFVEQGNAYIRLNLTNGTFGPRINVTGFSSSTQEPRIADLDADGDGDVYGYQFSPYKMVMHENTGNQVYGMEQTVATSSTFCLDHPFDLDYDGDLDLGGGSVWSENVGNLTLHTHNLYPYMGSYKDYQDFDGDGDLDVFEGDYYYENQFASSKYKLQGTVFFDRNSNKQYDSQDVPILNKEVYLVNRNEKRFTLWNGKYSFNVAMGVNMVAHLMDTNWVLTTDSSSYTVNVGGAASAYDSLDFGFKPKHLVTDILVDVGEIGTRCNSTAIIWVNYRNIGTTIPSGTIEVKPDTALTVQSFMTLPDSSINGVYYWSYDSLSYFKTGKVGIKVTLPNSGYLGDTIRTLAKLHQLDSSNQITYSNTDTAIQIVTCGYDPNDKIAWPVGDGSAHLMRQNEKLEYTVRFQNTSNDTAINVVVVDPIDPALNLSSFKFLSASDKVNIKIESDRDLVLRFDSIMLPDSTTDYLGSMGYFKYAISVDTTMPLYTRIQNTANIFFDYNSAIVTNTTWHTTSCKGRIAKPTITWNGQYFKSSASKGNSWYLNDSLLTGQMADSLVPPAFGVYTLIVTDSLGCFAESSPYYHYAVALKEYSENEAVIVPNPGNGLFHIYFNKQSSESFNVEVRDLTGRIVWVKAGVETTRENVINLHDVPSGIYIVNMFSQSSGKMISLGKLIVTEAY